MNQITYTFSKAPLTGVTLSDGRIELRDNVGVLVGGRIETKNGVPFVVFDRYGKNDEVIGGRIGFQYTEVTVNLWEKPDLASTVRLLAEAREKTWLSFPLYNCPGCHDGHDFCPPSPEVRAVEVKGEETPILTKTELEQVVYTCPTCGVGLRLRDYIAEYYTTGGTKIPARSVVTLQDS